MNDSSNLFETCHEIKIEEIKCEEGLCCTCSKQNYGMIKITDLDYDGRTFLEKLMACVSPTLEVDRENVPYICRVCITTLNLSFKFKRIALHSLRSFKCVVENEVEYEEEIKEESDFSDDHGSLPNDVEFDNDETEKAVHLISQPTDKEPDGKEEYIACVECFSTFSRRSEYEDHLVKIHNQKLDCELCGKQFKKVSRLREHIASHSSEPTYSCTNCDKAFTRMSSLKRHMTTHYAPPGQKSKKTPFLCTICGKSFPFSNGAARHMRIHFGIKTHKCEICNKQFNQSTHLQVHMRTHSGEKPYICEICGEKFTLKAGLHKHMKTKHKQVKKDDRGTLTLDDVFFN